MINVDLCKNNQPLSVARLVWLEDRFLLDPKLLIPKLLLDFLMFITLVAFLKGKTFYLKILSF